MEWSGVCRSVGVALVAVCLLPGCRLTEGLVAKAPPEEHGQPLECEQETSPRPSAPTNPVRDDSAPEDSEGLLDEKPHERPKPPAPPSPPRPDLPRGGIRRDSRRLSVGGQTVAVTVLDVPLGSFTLKLGLAKDRVGCTESLAAIARRHRAVAAINGCFFDAYSDRPVRNPYGNLISDGGLLHTSDHPTTLGVWPDGTVAIGRVRFRVEGRALHRVLGYQRWYAYGLNDYPEGQTWATIYTPQWSQGRTPTGLWAIVRNGCVAGKGQGSIAIPPDGYVAFCCGREAQLHKRFDVGQECTYQLTAESADDLDWLSAQEALGCGPLLVRNGEVCADPQAEGFRDPKILTNAGNRSAVGLTGDGHLLMITSSSATTSQLAQAMKALGCRSAMNLDGGASSGLFHQEAYLTRPGRDISNALLVLSR